MNVSILKSKLDGLAEAIGVKLKRRLPMTIDEMTTAVNEYAPSLQDKRVSPSKEEQTVEADDGFDYDGLGKVTIEAAKLQSKSVTISPATFIRTATSVADSGYFGLDRVDITVTAMPSLSFPTSTSSTASGSLIAGFTLTNGYKYINIPTGYNSSNKYYRLYVAGMTLPTSASDTSNGTQKAIIDASEATKYINIPAGYNSTASYYRIDGVYSTYIGSNVKRWSDSEDCEVLVPVKIMDVYTPVSSEWDEAEYFHSVRLDGTLNEYPITESMATYYTEMRLTIGDEVVYVQYAGADEDVTYGEWITSDEHYTGITHIAAGRENDSIYYYVNISVPKSMYSLSDLADKPLSVEVFVHPATSQGGS